MFFAGVATAVCLQLFYIFIFCKNATYINITNHMKEVMPVIFCMALFHVFVQNLYKDEIDSPDFLKITFFIFLTDLIMFFVHISSHKLKNSFHHTHHLRKKIEWNDAFHASFLDKAVMVAFPIIFASNTIRLNFVEYTTSGTIMGTWFIILHNNNFSNHFESVAKKLLLGSFKTHSVHHLKPNKNFGHFLMIYDFINGSYEYKKS